MISFVWSSAYPLMAGTGGSENYTVGHVRELARRNIPVRIITFGFGENDGRHEFPDINFASISNTKQLEELDETLIFVSEPMNIRTKNKSYVILHVPPSPNKTKDFYKEALEDKVPIVTSHYSATIWSSVLDTPAGDISVVYPFADEAFSRAKLRGGGGKIKTLFAGRLTPDKGIYTFMWVLHSTKIEHSKYSYMATNAGAHTPEGRIVYKLLKHHPRIRLIKARKTPEDMARLLASTDILVMPSSDNWWKEMFGIISIEAQHAGVRVVASNSGGIPETDCGGLILVDPDNPRALEEGILKATKMGRLSREDRAYAINKFTLRESVDKLLYVMNYQK